MKKISLSSSGLKNFIFDSCPEDQFEFIFNENSFVLHNVLAEFISPKVSRLHQSDPTINSICFNQINKIKISNEALSKLKLLSSGYSIDIKEEDSFQLKILSILFENDELFSKITELFPSKINEANVTQYISFLSFLYELNPTIDKFDLNYIIDFISSHFYSIDKSELKKLPVNILLLIISNDNLKLESEDSLFNFIKQLFEESSNFESIQLYEQIEFTQLSKNKFKEFINILNPSEITNNLWRKISDCFYVNKTHSFGKLSRYRYKTKQILFEGNPFEGIINYLDKTYGGNVADNKTVVVTESSVDDPNTEQSRNAVDLSNTKTYFGSKSRENSWLQYDFGERRVNPTHYSIRTRHYWDGWYLRNWVIEGSNTGNDNDWEILDSRQNDESLNKPVDTHTYNISNELCHKDKCYKYLRIRVTGKNSNEAYHLILSALEYFGELIEK